MEKPRRQQKDRDLLDILEKDRFIVGADMVGEEHAFTIMNDCASEIRDLREQVERLKTWRAIALRKLSKDLGLYGASQFDKHIGEEIDDGGERT